MERLTARAGCGFIHKDHMIVGQRQHLLAVWRWRIPHNPALSHERKKIRNLFREAPQRPLREKSTGNFFSARPSLDSVKFVGRTRRRLTRKPSVLQHQCPKLVLSS